MTADPSDSAREQTRTARRWQFGQYDASCGTQHTSHFAEDLGLIGCVVEGDDRHDPVEVLIRRGDRLSLAFLEPLCGSPLSAHGEFLPVRLKDGDLAAAPRESFGRCPAPPPTSSRRNVDSGAKSRCKISRSCTRFRTLKYSAMRISMAVTPPPNPVGNRDHRSR